MSKKLSQAEIDALVASLLAGESPPEQTDAPSAEPEPPVGQPVGLTNEAIALALAASAGAPAAEPEAAEPAAGEPTTAEPAATEPTAVEPEAAEPEAAAPTAAEPETLPPTPPLPFDEIVDLGVITDAEVNAALAVYRKVESTEPSRSGAAPAAAAPGYGNPSVAPAAAAVMAPDLNLALTAQTLPVMPPSSASYAASQAQAAVETRKVFAMAALSSIVMDIELTVSVELGTAHLSLREVLALGPGSVITLDKLANTQVDVKVNNVPLMKADVLAIGEKYGIRVTRSSLKVPAAS